MLRHAPWVELWRTMPLQPERLLRHACGTNPAGLLSLALYHHHSTAWSRAVSECVAGPVPGSPNPAVACPRSATPSLTPWPHALRCTGSHLPTTTLCYSNAARYSTVTTSTHAATTAALGTAAVESEPKIQRPQLPSEPQRPPLLLVHPRYRGVEDRQEAARLVESLTGVTPPFIEVGGIRLRPRRARTSEGVPISGFKSTYFGKGTMADVARALDEMEAAALGEQPKGSAAEEREGGPGPRRNARSGRGAGNPSFRRGGSSASARPVVTADGGAGDSEVAEGSLEAGASRAEGEAPGAETGPAGGSGSKAGGGGVGWAMGGGGVGNGRGSGVRCAAFINAVLTPLQERNLEQQLGRPVVDRVGLILRLFGQRARTREAQLQVELASLSHQLPRLVRVRGPDGRKGGFGGGPGWAAVGGSLGGGLGAGGAVTQVVSARQRGTTGADSIGAGSGDPELQQQRFRISSRIATLRRELRTVAAKRGVQRQGRRATGCPTVAIVGYTNVGKTTLARALCSRGEAALPPPADMLFATLDPAVRRTWLPTRGSHAVVADTVGFIRDLPVGLVASFRATLEEVLEADMLVHVLDASCPIVAMQRSAVLTVLRQLGVDEQVLSRRTVEVWNKVDLVDPAVRPYGGGKGGGGGEAGAAGWDARGPQEAALGQEGGNILDSLVEGGEGAESAEGYETDDEEGDERDEEFEVEEEGEREGEDGLGGWEGHDGFQEDEESEDWDEGEREEDDLEEQSPEAAAPPLQSQPPLQQQQQSRLPQQLLRPVRKLFPEEPEEFELQSPAAPSTSPSLPSPDGDGVAPWALLGPQGGSRRDLHSLAAGRAWPGATTGAATAAADVCSALAQADGGRTVGLALPLIATSGSAQGSYHNAGEPFVGIPLTSISSLGYGTVAGGEYDSTSAECDQKSAHSLDEQHVRAVAEIVRQVHAGGDAVPAAVVLAAVPQGDGISEVKAAIEAVLAAPPPPPAAPSLTAETAVPSEGPGRSGRGRARGVARPKEAALGSSDPAGRWVNPLLWLASYVPWPPALKPRQQGTRGRSSSWQQQQQAQQQLEVPMGGSDAADLTEADPPSYNRSETEARATSSPAIASSSDGFVTYTSPYSAAPQGCQGTSFGDGASAAGGEVSRAVSSGPAGAASASFLKNGGVMWRGKAGEKQEGAVGGAGGEGKASGSTPALPEGEELEALIRSLRRRKPRT